MRIKIGDNVKVLDGFYEGLEGVVDKLLLDGTAFVKNDYNAINVDVDILQNIYKLFHIHDTTITNNIRTGIGFSSVAVRNSKEIYENNGRLIVIEGTDSSGKETQTNLLYNRLSELVSCKRISFPNYNSEASAPVKMYLAGKFGDDANSVNPYAISTMYAVDRYASFKEDWERDYNNECLIISDRYATSNIIHQASKLKDGDKDNYIKWLEDLEYNKMKLPKPNIVIFLNMPPDKANKLMENRNNKITGECKKDIHEKDEEYLAKSHKNACEISSKLGWMEVSCVDGDRIRSIEEIHEEIYTKVTSKLYSLPHRYSAIDRNMQCKLDTFRGEFKKYFKAVREIEKEYGLKAGENIIKKD